MKKLLILVTLLVSLVTPSFAEYSKEEAYLAEQFQSVIYNNPSYIRFQKTEDITLHIYDVLHDKKPVTNEQKKAYDTISKKFRNWNREYALELEVIAETWKELIFDIEATEPTNEQEAKAIVDEVVKRFDAFFTAIKPIVDKYGKEVDKIEKQVKIYERM